MQNNYGVLNPFKCDADYYNQLVCLRVQNYATKSKIPNVSAIILLIGVENYATSRTETLYRDTKKPYRQIRLYYTMII